MSDDLDERRRRVLYRARHRGTKELDWLVGRFADARVGAMSADDLDRFERLVALPDPVIAQLVMSRGEDGGALCELISALRHFHGLSTDNRPGNDDGS